MKIIITILFFSFCYGNLIKPENAQELNYINILFEWEQEPDAISYNLQVSDSPSFNNLILDIENPITIYIDNQNFNWSNTYYWKISPIYNDGTIGNWSSTSFFSIKESVLINHLQVDIINNNLIEDGLIIYGQFSPDLLMGVVDRHGNEIWNAGVPDQDHMLGSLLNFVSDNGELYGKSEQSGIKLNFDEDILWETSDDVIMDLHELKQLSNGNYVAFVPIYEMGPIPLGWWTDMFQMLGYVADGETNEFPWLGLKIIEWDKDTREEVWSWNPFEHFTMDDYYPYGELWSDAYVTGKFDWLHSNSIDFNEQENMIYVSHRHLSRISKMSYPSGEVIWNMGLPTEYNMGDNNICTDLLFSWQHHVQILDNGDLLFFDNGNLSELLLEDPTPISRIRRIRVIDNNQCETVWQYDLPEDLYGAGTGSAQLLDNGNYLIYTLGGYDQCSILEITHEKEIVWKATAEDPSSSFYRAYKIPSIHPSAFSVIANDYTIHQNNQNESVPAIKLLSEEIKFLIINESNYNHNYSYEFKNPNGDWFIETEGQLNISEDESLEISFEGIPNDESNTNIIFNIWPNGHEYAKKELEFLVFYNPMLLGDINGDQILDISDVILLIQMALDELESEEIGDVNQDGGINILDVIQLVNIIILD